MKNAGHIIAERLKDHGIDRVFGLPGGEVTDLIEALRKCGIQFVLTRHETTAAFMADTYGAITGRPGVCISTLGPGATNMVTGVANAYLDRSPLIALTGELATHRYNRVPHQRLDLNSLYRAVTKWTATVEANHVAQMMEHAIRVATAERPGPVHLAVPSDLPKSIPEEPQALDWSSATANKSVPDIEDLKSVAERIEGANAPAVLAGLGALRCHASQAVRDLAEKLHIPVVVTPKAKGVVPEDSPLAAGVVEMYGDRVVFDLLKRADLLLAIGFDVVELDKLWILNTPVIHIDSVPDSDRFYPIEKELVGDLRATAQHLTEMVNPHQKWEQSVIDWHRTELRRVLTPASQGLAAHEVVDAVRAALPRQGIATCDTGAHKMLVSQLWEACEPQTYFVSNGLSSMGYSLAAAMTVKLLTPERPVVAFVGDGGLGMYLGELDTALRLQLPLIVVVLNDQSLWAIRKSQEVKGYPPTGVDFTGTRLDFAKIAETLGAQGLVVESAEACEAAVRRAVETKVLTVVDARIDPRAYRIEMAPSGRWEEVR